MGSIGNDSMIDILFIVTAVIFAMLVIITILRSMRLQRRLNRVIEENTNLKEINHDLETEKGDLSRLYDESFRKNEDLLKTCETMEKLAYMDSLTELPNRNSFMEMLDNIMLTIRKDEIIAIMVIDIDNFKDINESLGFSSGDELLLDITHRLKQVLDENDYLSRIGGDEFAILTQNLEDTISYEEQIKRIRNVFTYPFMLSSRECFVTVSIGVVFAPKDGKTPQILVKNLESAVYVAKDRGKNNYIYFEPSFNTELTNRIELQSDLRGALGRNEFKLYYQAQIDLINEKIVGFEALIRWEHPVRGMMYPKEFIHILEDTGLIVPIGEWVLRTACSQMKKWEDEGYTDISMAINISPRQFNDKGFVKLVQEVIEDTGVNPKNIELEITETIALDDLDFAKEVVSKLNKLGIRFSLDDFGIGYSSVRYLKTLPISNIKIDRSFLETIIDDKDDQKIIQAIIKLAKELELDVIAEGVERTDQEKFLIESNCNFAQGFLYSKPIPSKEAEELLKARHN